MTVLWCSEVHIASKMLTRVLKIHNKLNTNVPVALSLSKATAKLHNGSYFTPIRKIIIPRSILGAQWFALNTFSIHFSTNKTTKGNGEVRESKGKKIRSKKLNGDEVKGYGGRVMLKRREQAGMELVIELLQLYKRIKGDLLVPKSFKIPKTQDWPEWSHCYALGWRVSEIRQSKTKIQSEMVEIFNVLEKMKFVWSVLDDAHANNIELMKKFKEIHGHLCVPNAFVIPNTSDWPGWSIGCKLEYYASLNSLGFVWSVAEVESAKLLKALKIHKSIYGDYNTTKSFIVPHNSSKWPSDLHGYKLGITVMRARGGYIKIHKTSQAELKEMIEGEVMEFRRFPFPLVKRVLLQYEKKHGNMLVPVKFVITEEDAYFDKETWGWPLGLIVQYIRNHNGYREYRDELQSINFPFDPVYRGKNGEKVITALTIYKNDHGHLKVSYKFVVPCNDLRYPEEFRGKTLFPTLWRIRAYGMYVWHFKAKLVELGVEFKHPEHCISKEEFLEAVTCYKQAYPEHAAIFSDFVIPSNSKDFPPHLWGLAIGQGYTAVSNSRSAQMGPTHLALKELGYRIAPRIKKEAKNSEG